MSKRIPTLGLLGAVLLGAAGCVSLGHETPPVSHFLLSAAPPESAVAGPAGEPTAPLRPILMVYHIESDPPFDGQELLYRSSDTQWQQDYYNRFIANPGEMLTEATRRWLREKARPGSVVSPSAPVAPDYVLRGRLQALYGDYRTDRPAAVMEMEFTLTTSGGGEGRMLLARSYPARVPLASTTASDLVAGLDAALKQVLTALAADLGGVLAAAAAAPATPAAPSASPTPSTP